jgi:hypothetical protein
MPWKPDYLTLPEAKSFMRITDTVDDVEIGRWITAASRAIDAHCNRQFGQLAAPAARVYRRPAVWDPVVGMWLLPIDDVQDVTGMTVNGVAYASSGAVLLPDNAPAESLPWTAIGLADRPTVGYYGSPVSFPMFARWGWTAFPAAVPAATELQLNRWAARRDSPWGIAGSPDQGSEIRLLSRLDPDVVAMLRGLRRRRRVG